MGLNKPGLKSMGGVLQDNKFMFSKHVGVLQFSRSGCVGYPGGPSVVSKG